ncbi:hypothetical protein HB016_002568 [Salmonella enterica subsp. enterica]|nr:hypothetical protein [Salmonella enterica]EBQ9479965.1 hypothetical protein [Salmonella enterica subsp. enterica serovar Kokomlemle]ECS5198538.1 hypothetical protein [Salmonella enterica subsp. enterica serovar Poano]EBJ7122030.1 hypothetical protein [Salmonella enterica]ECX4750923.1 hypothetical protein [Salmonella enterica]
MNPFNYQQRQIDFHGTQTIGQVRLKLYYLKSQQQAGTAIPLPATQQVWLTEGLSNDHFDIDHQIGFAIIHAADDGYYLLISTWCDANMLRHRVFTIDDDNHLRPLDATKIIACVWELAVIFYERNCWIEHVMTTENLEEKNVQRYLQSGYSGWV